MRLQQARVMLTGAAGGIGSLLAEALVAKGARVALVDRDAEVLQGLAQRLTAQGGEVHPMAVDLLDLSQIDPLVERVHQQLGGIDLLINLAGLLSFRPFAEEDPRLLEGIMRLNLTVPMLLTRAVLPSLLSQGSGRIVNVGSIFGSIGFAWFSAYSASKFGLRGFSEALRRELKDSGIGVTYVAPRAVRTPLNTGAIYRMAEATGMNMDPPQWVAERVLEAIEQERNDLYLGFPEKLFVRINAILPRLVDAALRAQTRLMERFARER